MVKLVKKNSSELIDYVTTDKADDLPTTVLRCRQLVDKIAELEWEMQQWTEMLHDSTYEVSSQWAVNRINEIIKETSLKSSDDDATSDKADT